MLLLEAFGIKKYYGDRLVLDIPELKIISGDRIAVVGVNGAGKTTLLDILSGDLPPDEGYCKRYCEISYIRQFSEEKAEAKQQIVSEFLLSGKTERKTLSGGEQTRVKISNALSKNNLLLLADEPTSNLDYEGIELLRQKLSRLESLVLISHDRGLLDRLCQKTIEIKDGKIEEYKGNFSFYRRQSQQKHDQAVFEYLQYTSEKSRLKGAIRGAQSRAAAVKKAPKRMGNSEARLHRRSATESEEKLHNSAKAIKSRLEQLEVKEKPRETPKIKLDFSLTQPPQNKIVISGKDLCFGYNENLIFHQASFEVPNRSKIAVIGGNGTGKTTLLNLIFQNSEGISKVPKVKIGYFYQGFENLDFNKTIWENAIAGSVQNPNIVRLTLARLLFRGDDIAKKAAVLSGGEKVKLSLAKLLVSEANTLLLDEPTNYLDIDSTLAMQALLADYEGTLLFVSHDKEFVKAIADKLLIIQDQGLVMFEGNLDDYEKRNNGFAASANDTGKLLLKTRLSRIISDMSLAGADKDALEQEYEETLLLLKAAEADLKGDKNQ
ncbi:MAG: ABC-F type ribosomal protection protein [Clostridiales bacterium]|nr:ABC-F type ribosomal protection protein [Clostridiales bacterium]